MKNSKLSVVSWSWLVGASLFGLVFASEQGRPQAAGEKPAPSLIRMDLLALPPAKSGPPKRNIFSPRSSSPGQPSPPAIPEVASPGLLPANLDGAAERAAANPEAAPAFSVDLRYVGYVDSQRTRKIIGLVIFQGQARAVVEGEVISEGLRIGKISRKEIQVILPDSSTRSFSLEGEEL